ncbi:MAG: hypothetical protein WCO89_00505 [Syntrophus sp. (in: bacteria)]
MLGSILLGIGLGVVGGTVLYVFIAPFIEGGGISFPGTQKRRDINGEIDQRIENKRANGDFKHSKTELQEHWDQYHK